MQPHQSANKLASLLRNQCADRIAPAGAGGRDRCFVGKNPSLHARKPIARRSAASRSSSHPPAACSESSKQQNDQRLQLLAAKQKLIMSVLEAAKADLKKKAKGSGYSDMVATLLCQVLGPRRSPDNSLLRSTLSADCPCCVSTGSTHLTYTCEHQRGLRARRRPIPIPTARLPRLCRPWRSCRSRRRWCSAARRTSRRWTPR